MKKFELVLNVNEVKNLKLYFEKKSYNPKVIEDIEKKVLKLYDQSIIPEIGEDCIFYNDDENYYSAGILIDKKDNLFLDEISGLWYKNCKIK